MENNNNKKSGSKGVYLFFTLLLLALISAAVFVTLSGTANKTTPKTHSQSESTGIEESFDTKVIESTKETTAEQKTENASATSEEYYMPVSGYISKNFTMEFPVFSVTMNDYRTHNGVDIEADEGSAVYACAKGTVSKVYTDPFMGQCVEITHDNNMVSRYMSLSQTLSEGIAEGAEVYAGQPIAAVGESCKLEAADAPHLHFEMSVNEKNVNPLDYLGTLTPEEQAFEDK